MLDESDLKRALAGLSPADPIELRLCLDERHPLSERLTELAAQLAGTLPGAVLVRHEADLSLPARPGLALAHRGQRRIRYLAAPAGPEAAPFLEAMSQIATPVEVTEPWQKEIAQLDEPAELLVFIAAACPNCPQTVRAAIGLSLLTPRITTTIIDAQYFPALAKEYGAHSVPLTVLDGGLSITGAVRAAELAAQILDRGTPQYAARELASFLAVGRFTAAAARLRAGGAHPHFLASWRTSAMSERMAMMMAAERALGDDAAALDGLVDELIAIMRAETSDASLRGDTADLLGKIGLPAACVPLRALLADENPDVVEIAEESLAAIAEAGRG